MLDNSDEHDAEHGARRGSEQPPAQEQSNKPGASSSQQDNPRMAAGAREAGRVHLLRSKRSADPRAHPAAILRRPGHSRQRVFRVCQSCNSGKGGRRLYEWKGLVAKDEIPRIAEGKYLKLLYDLHDKRGMLNVDKTELCRTMCPACDLKPRCIEAAMVEKLTVYCLEGVFHG